MIRETIKNMRVDYKLTKKDWFDLFILVSVFLIAARLEVIL